MRDALIRALALILFSSFLAAAQTSTAKSLLGTVTSINAESKTIELKPDNAGPVPLRLLANTIVQKIAPGETNLRNAVAIGDWDLVRQVQGDAIWMTDRCWIGHPCQGIEPSVYK